MRRLAAAVAIIAVLALAAVAHAQAPTPTAEPELSMFPYRIVITGPASIPEGQPVIFDVRYQRISSAAGSNNQIVLVHEGADFGSIAARQGEAPDDLGPQNADAERIALLSDAGEFDVTLRPHAGFAGALTLTFYVPGTGIALPDGTVDHATTEIVGAGDVVVTVFNDLNTNGVRDDGEPGVAGWQIDAGCGDAQHAFTTDANGLIVVGTADATLCLHLERQFGWLPTHGGVNLVATRDELRAGAVFFGVHDYGRGVMELHGETIYRGLPLAQPDPGIAAPFAACGHSFVEYELPNLVEVAVIVESSATRDGCPSAGAEIAPSLGGPGPAGPQLTFAPGTTALGTWVDGGDSMRFYASDVTDAWVLDVASGRLTKGCAVTMPLHGGLQPPGFARVFVLSDEVRAGCGAPGRMVRLVRGDQLLDPILNWQAGDLAQPPQLTIAVLSVTPPNAGDGASAARAGRTPLAVALGALALACAALSGGLLPRRRSR